MPTSADVHVHTKYSFDAYIFGTRNDPNDAYRFAKGEALTHAAGVEMKLKAPLDFLAVSDHATYLGMFEQMDKPRFNGWQTSTGDRITKRRDSRGSERRFPRGAAA